MNRLIALPTLLLIFTFLLTSPSSNSICTQPAHAQPEGTLILNEISPLPSSGNPWLEILNPTSEQIAVAGN
jgi:hypothetical protein